MKLGFGCAMRHCIVVASWLLPFLVQQSSGHGTMMEPVPRQPESMYWYQVGCMIGCTCSGGGKEQYPSLAGVKCKTPGKPTLTKGSELTWNTQGSSPMGQWNQYMPWRAPGTAIPLDACGIASGFLPTEYGFPHTFASGVKQGTKGTDLPAGKVTVWAPGSVVQASYRLSVNHGGGYQYRVCPKTESPTEACFQANPLAFADSKTTVVYNTGKRITLNAVDVSTGVQPAGHAWRRLPMPACACDLGSGCQNITLQGKAGSYVAYKAGASMRAHGHCKFGLQFEAPHLTDGTWTDGFGYYVSKLDPETTKDNAERTKSKSAIGVNICSAIGVKITCEKSAKEGCLWTEAKGLCYMGKVSAKTSDGKTAGKTAGGECAKIKDQSACDAATKTGCIWYAPKKVCYAPDAKDKSTAAKDTSKDAVGVGFGGAGTKEASTHQWWITDDLVAPSKIGEYIMQWRWDNDQTPQVWTTCADIRVGAPSASASIGSRVGGAAVVLHILLWAAMAKVW